ncbi:MAG: 4Fe-4S dicluster domain-containing protein, partial [Clostridia bacterium]|nr:4Fe-4S dicluster domain-containing protein [Clostridia bacterium]
GGPMMGVIETETDGITKTTNSIFVFPSNHYLLGRLNSDLKIEVARAAASCCQCQLCTDLCPRHNLGHPIEPHRIMRAAACNNFKDIEAFTNTFYCCACGICELYACPQGLSPRKLISAIKGGLRKSGIKPSPDVKAADVSKEREYRKVPIERLVSRLGVREYISDAPLDNNEKTGFTEVKIKLSQHIGAPAVSTVKFGDKVKKGDVIAKAADGLSVNIHASIDGIVTKITDKFIILNADGNEVTK